MRGRSVTLAPRQVGLSLGRAQPEQDWRSGSPQATQGGWGAVCVQAGWQGRGRSWEVGAMWGGHRPRALPPRGVATGPGQLCHVVHGVAEVAAAWERGRQQCGGGVQQGGQAATPRAGASVEAVRAARAAQRQGWWAAEVQEPACSLPPTPAPPAPNAC